MERLFCKVESPGCVEHEHHHGDGRGGESRRRLRAQKQPQHRRRSPSPDSCVKPLFVTGTAGSGTHFVADYLAKITARHIRVKHEGPKTSPDILVSWPSRCLRRTGALFGGGKSEGHNSKPIKLQFGGLFPVKPKQTYLKPPMVKWAEEQTWEINMENLDEVESPPGFLTLQEAQKADKDLLDIIQGLKDPKGPWAPWDP